MRTFTFAQTSPLDDDFRASLGDCTRRGRWLRAKSRSAVTRANISRANQSETRKGARYVTPRRGNTLRMWWHADTWTRPPPPPPLPPPPPSGRAKFADLQTPRSFLIYMYDGTFPPLPLRGENLALRCDWNDLAMLRVIWIGREMRRDNAPLHLPRVLT